MATPKSGNWHGLLVCADRAIKVRLSLNFSKDGTLSGEYSFRDKKYSGENRAGSVEGAFADNIVVIHLTGQDYSASFHGEVHAAPPNKQEVMFGLVHVHRRKTEAGALVMYSQLAQAETLSGWNGS